MKSLYQIVKERPFPDYAAWWEMGHDFLRFMSQAITSQWGKLQSNQTDVSQVQRYAADYVRLVYSRDVHPSLSKRFQQHDFSNIIYSGEFDALSYAFYRSAFESLEQQFGQDQIALAKARRSFTKNVGELFFTAIHDHLQLNLPTDLKTDSQFAQLQESLTLIGQFLQEQGYLRDSFTFTFDVNVNHLGSRIKQETTTFLENLNNTGIGYALYEMGYPAILPSAVYLYHTMGEAQHHSSRTIEELFQRVGFKARETDDFDPIDYPSDKVVELWEIQPL